MQALWRSVICAALLFVSMEANADDDVAKAAKAYRQAQQAELGEEYALASDLYELADQLAPSPEALRGATRMALSAERWAVAAGLARTLQLRYPDDKSSQALATQTLERTRPLLSEVTVECGGVECSVLVDGKAATLVAQLEHVVFLAAGTHAIAGGFPSGSSESVEITATAGGSNRVVLVPPRVEAVVPAPAVPNSASDAPASPPADRQPRPRRSRQRLSPAFFGVGAVATAGLGAGLVVSGLAARRAGDDFTRGGYTRELYDEAQPLETQTNILLGVTVAVGVTTVILAVFTDWDRHGGRARDKKVARGTSRPRLAATGLGFDF
jgi:hypothetical protein